MDASQMGKLEIRALLDIGLKLRAKWCPIMKVVSEIDWNDLKGVQNWKG